MNKKEKQLSDQSVFNFLNLSNLQIYFVIPAKSLTQIEGMAVFWRILAGLHSLCQVPQGNVTAVQVFIWV